MTEDVEHALHTFLTERCQPIDIRPAAPHCARCDREGFVDVRAAANPAVHQNRNPSSHGVHHLRKNVYRAATGFDEAAMVGDKSRRSTGPSRKFQQTAQRITAGQYSNSKLEWTRLTGSLPK